MEIMMPQARSFCEILSWMCLLGVECSGRRNSTSMELISWWRTNIWAGSWRQPGFSLFWSSWIKVGTHWPWRSFPTKMTLWFSLLVLTHYRFASRISCGAFQVKMGKLHVFGLICLTLARHFWGHCATAAPCLQLQGLTAWSWGSALLSPAHTVTHRQRELHWGLFFFFSCLVKSNGGFFFPPPERTAVFGLRKDEVKKWQEKAVSLCFLVAWLLFCTCTRLALVRTGALLGSQNGAVAEETSSTLQSHPVFSFSLCHHFTEQNPRAHVAHFHSHPALCSCQDGKVAATSSKGINWQVILRTLFPLGMYLLCFSRLQIKRNTAKWEVHKYKRRKEE